MALTASSAVSVTKARPLSSDRGTPIKQCIMLSLPLLFCLVLVTLLNINSAHTRQVIDDEFDGQFYSSQRSVCATSTTDLCWIGCGCTADTTTG